VDREKLVLTAQRGNVTGTERAFELGISGIDTPFIGVVDLAREPAKS
jgi:hypothetical protein